MAIAMLVASTAEAQPRPDTPGADLLFQFEETEVVEATTMDPITVHFTRSGPNQVPDADADANGLPDFVEEVAAQYVEALAFYESEGFAAPLADTAGGGPELDVYLLDLFGTADGSYQRDDCDGSGCRGYLVHENDFVGYGYSRVLTANRIVASHELFHAVQAAYASGIGTVFSEGTATWATERFDGSLRDFELALRGYLADPERPLNLDVAGVVLDRFAYGSALFFRFLEERFDPEVVRMLVEAHEGGGASFLEPLDAILRTEGSSFAEAFVDHTRWNLRTGRRWRAGESYVDGATYPAVAPRDITLPLRDERPRHFHAAARYYRAEAGDRAIVTASLVGDDVESLVLWGAVEADELRLVDAPDGRLELSDAADATVWIVVVHPALEGPSARSSVCVGSPIEVEACEEALAPEPEPDGGPMMDAGVAADAGAEGSGGGCSVAASTVPLSWPLLLLVTGLVRRRRAGERLGH